MRAPAGSVRTRSASVEEQAGLLASRRSATCRPCCSSIRRVGAEHLPRRRAVVAETTVRPGSVAASSCSGRHVAEERAVVGHVEVSLMSPAWPGRARTALRPQQRRARPTRAARLAAELNHDGWSPVGCARSRGRPARSRARARSRRPRSTARGSNWIGADDLGDARRRRRAARRDDQRQQHERVGSSRACSAAEHRDAERGRADHERQRQPLVTVGHATRPTRTHRERSASPGARCARRPSESVCGLPGAREEVRELGQVALVGWSAAGSRGGNQTTRATPALTASARRNRAPLVGVERCRATTLAHDADHDHEGRPPARHRARDRRGSARRTSATNASHGAAHQSRHAIDHARSSTRTNGMSVTLGFQMSKGIGSIANR